jgi:hypothetical protein
MPLSHEKPDDLLLAQADSFHRPASFLGDTVSALRPTNLA